MLLWTRGNLGVLSNYETRAAIFIFSIIILQLLQIAYKLIDPLHSVRNSETEEITIFDWLEKYESDDVEHILPQIDYNLQNLSINKLK